MPPLSGSFCFQTGAHYKAQAILELRTLLPQPPQMLYVQPNLTIILYSSRSRQGVSSSTVHFIFRQGLSLNPELMNLTRLPGQQVPGIYLSLLPPYWDYSYSLRCSHFYMNAFLTLLTPLLLLPSSSSAFHRPRR